MQRRIECDAAQQIRIETIEDAAMPLDHRAGILHACVALERRFDEISDLCGNARCEPKSRSLPPLEVELVNPARGGADGRHDDQGTDRTLDGFLGRDAREAMPPDARTYQHRERVGEHD